MRTETDIFVMANELASYLMSEKEYTNAQIMELLSKRHGLNAVMDLLKELRGLTYGQKTCADLGLTEERALP